MDAVELIYALKDLSPNERVKLLTELGWLTTYGATEIFNESKLHYYPISIDTMKSAVLHRIEQQIVSDAVHNTVRINKVSTIVPDTYMYEGKIYIFNENLFEGGD